jgi:hypothetical protein
VSRELDALAAVTAKLAALINEGTDYWISVSEVVGSGCALNTSVEFTVHPCGQEIGSNLVYFLQVLVNYVVPSLVNTVHALSMTYVGPAPL